MDYYDGRFVQQNITIYIRTLQLTSPFSILKEIKLQVSKKGGPE